MKKLLLILALMFPVFIYAKDIIIDERITNIYFCPYENNLTNRKNDKIRIQSSDVKSPQFPLSPPVIPRLVAESRLKN
jgi:hypothetical protein